MPRGMILTLLTAVLFNIVSLAQAKVTLRASQTGDMEFSQNDSTFHEVGKNFRMLREALADDTIAVRQIDTYNSHSRTSAEVLILGCAMAALPVYDAIANKWDSTGTPDAALAVGAVGLALVSMIIHSEARHHLTVAVKGYNRRHRNTVASVTTRISPVLYERRLGVRVVLNF